MTIDIFDGARGLYHMKKLLFRFMFAIGMTGSYENDDSDRDMSEQRRVVPSCHRKLPTIPHHRRQPGYWPPYKTAVDWMQRNRNILETALALVEIHPRLIQNKVCDKLYDFVSSVTQGMDSSDHVTPALAKGGLKEQYRMKIQEESPTFKSNKACEQDDASIVQNIFVCGIFSCDRWTKFVMDLCNRYFVMCTDQEHEQTFGVCHADIFIFLLDEESNCDNHCLRQLETALAWDKPIIFIRDENTPMQTQNERLHISHAKTQSETNLKDMLHRNDEIQTRCLSQNNNDIICDTNTRPHTIENIAPCHSTPDLCRLHEILTINGEPIQDKQRTYKNATCKDKAADTSHSFSICLRKEIDDGHRNSLLYQKHQHKEFMSTIFPVITKEYARSDETKTYSDSHNDNPTHVTDKNTISQTSEENNLSSHKPESELYAKGGHNENILYTNDSDSSSQETIYLIYAKDDIAQGSPKVVHWPSDLKEGNMSHSPSIDSFGFEDIDLSKSVNNLDIFYDSDSE